MTRTRRGHLREAALDRTLECCAVSFKVLEVWSSGAQSVEVSVRRRSMEKFFTIHIGPFLNWDAAFKVHLTGANPDFDTVTHTIFNIEEMHVLQMA
jgi:hypothetical protein